MIPYPSIITSDASGQIAYTSFPELHRKVASPVELIETLASSRRVEQVFVRHVFRFFIGRNETLGDANTLSWGTNLFWASSDGALMIGQWWIFVPSGLAIALVAFALALCNYAVDEVTNPRLRRPRTARSATAPTTVARKEDAR